MGGNTSSSCASTRLPAIALVALVSFIGLLPAAQAQRDTHATANSAQRSATVQRALNLSELEAKQRAKELRAAGNAAPAGRGPAYTPKSMYIFGDSMSDTGDGYARFYDVFTGFGFKLYPPYYAVPRWSNGLMWPDYLGTTFGLTIKPQVSGGTNYAIAGSTVSPEGIYNARPEMSGYAQVDQYLTAFHRAHPQAVHIVWIGGNDIESPASLTEQAFDQLVTLIGRLHAAGAHRFLVPTYDDAGKLPLVISWGDPAYAQQLSDMTVLFNQLLMTLPARFPSADIRIADVFRLKTMIDRYPGAFGFTNTTDGCYKSYADGSICSDPNKHWFWDGSHPTTPGHKWIANLFALEIAKAGWLK